VAHGAAFFDRSPEKIQEIINLNMVGFTLLTKYSMKGFFESNQRSAIVQLASINIHLTLPTVGIYGASKRFDHRLAAAINV